MSRHPFESIFGNSFKVVARTERAKDEAREQGFLLAKAHAAKLARQMGYTELAERIERMTLHKRKGTR